MSNVPGPTRFLDEAAQANSVRNQMREQLRKLPKVDANGNPITSPAPTPTEVTTTGAGDEAMLTALQGVTAALGVNLRALVDSERFTRKVGEIESDDTAALSALVSECLAANPALANPVVPSSGGASLDALRASTATATELRIAQRLGGTPTNQGAKQ